MTRQALKSFLALVFILSAITACREKPEIVEQIRAIETITVSDSADGLIRKFSGIVHAVDSSNLSFEVSGKVASVEVDIGDRVEKDQVLATLDTEPYLLDVDAAEAELLQARAQIANAEKEYQRQKRVYEQGAGTQSKLDRAKYDYKVAVSGVNYQIAKLNLAKRNLRETTLTAPYDGHIAWRSVEPHEEIRTGQKIFEIDAKGAMEVWLAVPETVIRQLNIGDSAAVSFTTLPDASVKGRISYIGSAAIKANAFPVKVGLIDPPAAINPGMTAEAALILKDKKPGPGFLIPVQAIQVTRDVNQGHVFVYDAETSTVRKTPVHIRDVQQNMIAVSKGLSSGDVIATAGVSFLADGMKVKRLEPQSDARGEK